MKSLAVLIPLFLNVLTITAQDYLWPTNASQVLSSNFGEYRRNHFHAGLDIKTNQRTGYPVFAVSDGYIWKIRISHKGYGKVIYQKLNDGNFAVYAHLLDFAEQLRNYIVAEQVYQQRFSVEIIFAPNQLRISKGEVIGYTGDSGTQVPHLHFEIRDSAECPLNPLTNIYSIKDDIAPVIEAVALIPAAVDGCIEGQPLSRSFPVAMRRSGNYYLRDTVQVAGTIGVEVKTFDQARGAANHYPPYGIKLYVDDTLRYHVQYDKFSYEQTRFAEIDRNYQLEQEMGMVFNRLWAFDQTKVLPMRLGDDHGLLSFKSGLHHLRIEVYDVNGNRSFLQGVLRWAPATFLHCEGWQSEEDGYHLFITKPEVSDLHFQCEWVTFFGNFARRVNDWDIIEKDQNYSIRIDDRPQKGEVLKITAADRDGKRYYPVFVHLGKSENVIPALQYQFVHNPKTFAMKLIFMTPPPNNLQFFLQTSADLLEVPLIALSPTEFITTPVPFSWWQKAFKAELRIKTIPVTLSRFRLNLKCITPESATYLRSSDSLLVVYFPAKAVYDTLMLWWGNDKYTSPTGGKFESALYSFYPINQPLHDSVEVSYKIGVPDENFAQIGIYQYLDDQWRWLGNNFQQESGYLKAKTRRMGTVALLRDNMPPEIKGVFPGSGGKFRASMVNAIRAIVGDNLSGIPDDLAIQVELDGQSLIVEYNAVKHKIYYAIPEKLKSGRHVLRIKACDRAQNISTFTSNFIILPD